MRRSGGVIALTAGLTLFSAASALAANDTAASNAPARLEMTSDGPMLVAASGKTLYVNSADRNGQSTCRNVVVANQPSGGYGATGRASPTNVWAQQPCTTKWPPYLADAAAQPVGDFGLIDREEGGKQWTWKGRPLYYAIKDVKPGDRWGASFQFRSAYQVAAEGGRAARGGGGGFGYAPVPFEFPPTLRLARFENDLVLTAANQQPVFTPKKGADVRDEMLLPILASEITKLSGDWSIMDAADGRKQYAFRGKPLYSMPEGVQLSDIAEAGEWELVVFEKGANKPPQIATHFSFVGDVYATKEGQTLYLFNCSSGGRGGGGGSCDDPGDPAGYWVAICGTGEECAKRWRPYIATADAQPMGEWSLIDVAYPVFTDPRGFTAPPEVPRVKAWAYRGKPVWSYYEDSAPGDIWGHRVRWGFGGSSMMVLQVPGREVGRGG